MRNATKSRLIEISMLCIYFVTLHEVFSCGLEPTVYLNLMLWFCFDNIFTRQVKRNYIVISQSFTKFHKALITTPLGQLRCSVWSRDVSTRADDSRLLGIPRSREPIASLYP